MGKPKKTDLQKTLTRSKAMRKMYAKKRALGIPKNKKFRKPGPKEATAEASSSDHMDTDTSTALESSSSFSIPLRKLEKRLLKNDSKVISLQNLPFSRRQHSKAASSNAIKAAVIAKSGTKYAGKAKDSGGKLI
jgi:hypothetical protein